MSDYGIDRYEAENIARSVAVQEAGDVKRDLSYELDSLRDEIRRLRDDLTQEIRTRREADATLDSMIFQHEH